MDFKTLFEAAAARHGGVAALEARIAPAATGERTAAEIAALGDDRLLSAMTRRVFQAGFNWSVIDKKWDGFEAAFEGFPVGRWALMSDTDQDRLLQDTRIVRHAKKIESVRDNAVFLQALAAERGTAARAIADWPATDFAGLLNRLKRDAARMGGMTGPYFLRAIGKESFSLSQDVVAALIRAGVVDKAPTSKAAMRAVQAAFDGWREESGRSLTQISRVLAMSGDA